jgi:hypothetical protein
VNVEIHVNVDLVGQRTAAIAHNQHLPAEKL